MGFTDWGVPKPPHPTPSQNFCLEYLNLVVRVKVVHILIKGCLIGLKKVPRQRQELDENRQSWWSQSKISFPHRRNQEKFLTESLWHFLAKMESFGSRSQFDRFWNAFSGFDRRGGISLKDIVFWQMARTVILVPIFIGKLWHKLLACVLLPLNYCSTKCSNVNRLLTRAKDVYCYWLTLNYWLTKYTNVNRLLPQDKVYQC